MNIETAPNPEGDAMSRSSPSMFAETTSVQATLLQPCYSCQHQPSPDDAFCESCGYPLKGTEDEQNTFINNRNYKHLELSEIASKVKKATNSLYVLAAFSVVMGIVYYAVTPEGESPMIILITNLVLATIYLCLALWSKTQAVAAIVSGLSLFIVVQILNMIADPTTLYKGIIFKVAIVIYLIKGVQSAFEAQKIKKQLNLK